METMQNKKVVGVYHKDCPDGTTAAAILLTKFSNAELFPLALDYQSDELNEIIEAIKKDTVVYLLDMALHEGDTEKLLARGAEHITVISHHEGEEEILRSLAATYDNFSYIFDTPQCGAPLTWAHFYGKNVSPEIVQYIKELELYQKSTAST